MKPRQSAIDSFSYKHELASHLIGAEITSYAWEKSLVVLDTNILLWMFRLNDVARSELLTWLRELSEERRLGVPAWVVHEYNTKVENIDKIALQPFRANIKATQQLISSLDSNINLVVTDETLRGTNFENCSQFFEEWNKTRSQLEQLKKVLAKCKKSRTEDVVQELQSLIESAAWETDVAALLADARSEGRTRYTHKLAPGFRDAEKTENCYGDYIIWKEILAQARERDLAVTLLTNDAKDDWVYRPKSLQNAGERNRQPNDGRSEPIVRLAQPYLDAEFAKVVCEDDDRRFYVADTVMLAHLLGSNTFNPQLHGQFQSLLRAASSIAEDTPTHAVIGWFLNNPNEYSNAIHGVCRWERCPSEVSEKTLADFVASKLPELDADRVEWGQVITELFL